MSNPRLAARYAKSIVDLSTEQNQLDAVYTDMKFFKEVFKSNPDLVALFESPIIKADKKEKIVAAVVAGRVGKHLEGLSGCGAWYANPAAGDDQHLCIDVHAFANGRVARASDGPASTMGGTALAVLGAGERR